MSDEQSMMTRTSRPLEEAQYNSKQITKSVIGLSWPVLLDMTLASLFGMVDMIIVGQYNGGATTSAANVAAIGFTNTPMFFSLTMVQAIGVGATALIARAYGAKQHHRLAHILQHAIAMGISIALPLAALGILFQRPIMIFLGAQDDALFAGHYYYKFIMVGFIFNSLNSMVASAVRGVGETKVPMRINIVANLTNIIFDILLVNGWGILPEWGIIGAGIATLMSNLVSSMSILWYVSSGKSVIKLRQTSFTFQFDTFKSIIQLGLPSAGEQFFLRVGLMLYTKTVASLGTLTVAAHQIALNVLSLSFTPGMALGMAASALIGQSLGALQPKLADLYGKKATQFALIIGISAGIFFYVVRFHAGLIYSSDAEVVRLVAIPLTWMSITVPFQMTQLTQAGALRGAGDTVFPMISTSISIFSRVAISYVLVTMLGFGLNGAWQANLVDQLIRSLLITVRYRRGKWQLIKL